MTQIESKKINVNATSDQVMAFLRDMNNIEKLLPPGKYSEWKSDGNSCSFKIQNAYTIELIFESQEANKIVYVSGTSAPFKFSLTSFLQPAGSTTEGYMLCDADINPFLKMIVQGPLKNLFDYMADRLQANFAS